MNMDFKLFVTLVFAFICCFSFGQTHESKMYLTAYAYLNDSIISVKYGTAKDLRDDCRQTVKGQNLRFSNRLQVANRFIENDWGFPLCDLLKKKYKVTESCVYALRSGQFELTKYVEDSLRIFWDFYEMKSKSSIMGSLEGIISERKDGFVVFFSDIYKNTLAAEIKSFCLPYDTMPWFGSSTSFFFVFNEDGEVDEVYSGVSIHYN